MSFYFAAAPYSQADIIIIGIPFDRTSSFIPGSRFAPNQIRSGFENVESYSSYQKKDLTSYKIHDAGDMIFPSVATESILNSIENEIKKHLHQNKSVLAIGGEHTITIPIIQAYKEAYPNLKVVQFDAHADLRDEYLGEKFCHATTMQRVAETVGQDNIFQVGIRSLAKEEAKAKTRLFRINQPINKLVQRLANSPVYLTLDIDVMNTGEMPATSTPEPGGISFVELVSILTKLTKCNIVGADLVEYNPLAAPSLAYAATAAVLIREMLFLLVNKKHKQPKRPRGKS